VRGWVGLVAAALVLAGSGCSNDNGQAPASSTTIAPTTTTAPPNAAIIRVEQDVANEYRQGLARVDGGWIFSTNNAFFRTDDQLVEQARLLPAIPDDWAAQGYNHIGDIDVAGGVLYAPFEKDDKEAGEQAMARYDAETLAFIDAFPVAQHHSSFVTVDPETMIAYSQDYFGGDALLRYDISGDGWVPLEPLQLSTYVDRVQGADFGGGSIYLSADDAIDGVYRVDLETGEVTHLGSLGHIDGEAEGVDYAETADGDLHALTVDVASTPVRLVHLDLVAQ